jgi:uncharacterized membrane protein
MQRTWYEDIFGALVNEHTFEPPIYIIRIQIAQRCKTENRNFKMYSLWEFKESFILCYISVVLLFLLFFPYTFIASHVIEWRVKAEVQRHLSRITNTRNIFFLKYTTLHSSTEKILSIFAKQTRYTESKHCSLIPDLLHNLRSYNVLTFNISLLC